MTKDLRSARIAAVAAGVTPARQPRILCRYLGVQSQVQEGRTIGTNRTTGHSRTFPAVANSEGLVKVSGENDECNSWEWEKGDTFTIVSWQAPVEISERAHANLWVAAELTVW